MKIGIIAAEQEEFEAILNIAKVEERKEIYELNFVKCKIKDKICVLVKSGVGKVNAARATQILIDNFKPDYIVNVGVAGGLNPMLSIGDIVIGETLVQHDFDITAFGHAKGYIPGVGEKIYADDYLVKKIEEAIGNQEEKVYKYEFNAECVEMEGAAIGQVCSLCNVPFVVIRSISDTPNGENEVTYEKFIKLASERCANILKDFVKTIE